MKTGEVEFIANGYGMTKDQLTAVIHLGLLLLGIFILWIIVTVLKSALKKRNDDESPASPDK